MIFDKMAPINIGTINIMNEMTDTPFINDGTSMKIVRFNVSIKAHF